MKVVGQLDKGRGITVLLLYPNKYHFGYLHFFQLIREDREGHHTSESWSSSYIDWDLEEEEGESQWW